MEEPRTEIEGQGAPQVFDQQNRRINEAKNRTRGMIHMISGGATDGDSGRARKARGKRMENFEMSKELNLTQDLIINFGPEDLRGVVAPHNDALVVTVTVVNYDITRIFIDSGSSEDILFRNTLDQINIEGFELESISTPLNGFTDHALQPMGSSLLHIIRSSSFR
ncbi:uncharacterized protein [Henckelia pumila]|uniref:uncharacterized protein n=1 Tax=Henckelia pumila TaxID=405737 RepID=UPI003C6E4836